MSSRYCRLFPAPALCLLLALCARPALAAGPLQPVDTSSPRATLTGYLASMNAAYAQAHGVVDPYLASSRLYMDAGELARFEDYRHRLLTSERALDLSGLPPATARESSRRLVILLKEVLDRLELPDPSAVPDAEAMAKAEFKRWTLPGSEIRIQRVEGGPRAGEYLFSPETMARLPEFYAKVKNLPYRPGATPGWHEFASYTPAGLALALGAWVPPRWLLEAPGWSKALVFDQPLWRWAGILAVLGAGLAFVLFCFRLGRRFQSSGTAAGRLAYLLCPGSLVLAAPLAAFVLAEVLRVSGAVYDVATLSLWSLFYLALTWLVWAAGGALAEGVIAAEDLRVGSIDGQLIRLVVRLLTVAAAVLILVAGADRVGLPAYSVLAGLGVGGLAVALAAQQTLANLLGSLIIMFEKPFAVGHWVRLKEVEGTVEAVGFRSTRIRTFYNSLVTIPSSQLVNSTVDNMELREWRQVKAVLSLVYATPPGDVERFVEGVRAILAARPDTRKDVLQVYFYELGPSSLDVLVNFFLKAPSRGAELAARQAVFLDILRLAESLGVAFAFPTQTLHIDSLPAGPLPPGPAAGEAVQ